MSPTYEPGDLLLGWRGPFRPRPRQVVVARQGSRPIIKRVAAVGPGGCLTLRGDNAAASTDSRHFGDLPRTQLEAVIILKW